jgi:hypothetical protein
MQAALKAVRVNSMSDAEGYLLVALTHLAPAGSTFVG